jgi:TonB family protein
MRAVIFSLFAFFAIVDLAPAQTVDVPTPRAGELPMFRPALIGNGPDAIINTINTKELISKGQKNAVVMFSCIVGKTGSLIWSGTYRGTPGSKLLEDEVQKRLGQTKFIPAIRKNQPVIVVFYGTVMFSVIEGKPRLRIFANQQVDELKNENDFIDPQPYIGAESGFSGTHYPDTGSPVSMTGTAELSVQVDAEGNLKDIQLISEYPPLLGFGDAAMSDFRYAKFIPAFRNGQPVESKVNLPVYFLPKE